MSRFFIILFVFLLTSCASIVYNNRQTVEFVSDKPDVAVYIDGEFVGRTPVKHEVSTKSRVSIFYTKDDISRETIIAPMTFPGGFQGFLCGIDIFPGIFLFVPFPVDLLYGSCRTFKSKYLLPITRTNSMGDLMNTVYPK